MSLSTGFSVTPSSSILPISLGGESSIQRVENPQSVYPLAHTPPELRQTPQDTFRKALVDEEKMDVSGRWLGEEMDLPKIPPPLKEYMREKFSEPIELVEGQKSPFIPLKFLQHTVYLQNLFTVIKVLVPGSSIRSFFIYKFKDEGNRDTSYLDLCMQKLGIEKWLTDELRNGIPIESQDFDVRIEGVPTDPNVKDLLRCLTYAISQAVSALVGQEVKLHDDVITNKGKCFSHVQFEESPFEVVFSNRIPRPFQSTADNLTCSLTGGEKNWSFEQALVCPGQHTLQPILDTSMRVVYLYRPEQLNDRCLKFFALMARMWTVEGSLEEMEQLLPKKHVFEERLKDVFEKHCTKKNIDFAYTTLIHLWLFQSIRPNPDDPEKQIPPFKEMVDILESMNFFKEMKENKPSAPVKHLKTLLTGASEEATKDLLTFLEVAAFSSIHGEGSPIRWTRNFRGPAFSWAFSEAEKGKSSPGLTFPFSLDRADYKKIFAQLKNLEGSQKQKALAGLWKCLHPHSQLFGAKRPFSAKKLFHNLVKTSLNSQHPCAPDLVKGCFPFIADELSLEEWRELDLLSPPISQYPYTPQLLESSLPHIADKLALEDWKLLGAVFPRLFSQQLCRKEIREKFIKQKQLRELLVPLADTLDVERFRQLTGFWDDLPEYFTSFFADWLRAKKTDRAAEWVAQREGWAAELNSQECINWIQWLVLDQKQLDESSPQLTKWLAPLFENPEEGAKWIQAYPRLFIEKLDFSEEHLETREFRQKYIKALAYYYSLLTQVTIADYPSKLRVAWERYHPEDDIVAIRFNRMAGEKLNEEQFLDLLKLIKVMKAPKAEHWQRLLTAALSLKSAEVKQKVLSLIFKNMKRIEDWQALNPSEEVTKNLAQLIGNFPKACWKISSDWLLHLAPFWPKEKILTIVFHCPQKALEEHRHVLKTLLGMAIGSVEDARRLCPETVLSEEKRQRWEKLSALFSDRGEKVEEVEEVEKEEEKWTIGDSIQWVLNRGLYLARRWSEIPDSAKDQPELYLGEMSKDQSRRFLESLVKDFRACPQSNHLFDLLIAFSKDYEHYPNLWKAIAPIELSSEQLIILEGIATARLKDQKADPKEKNELFSFFYQRSKETLSSLIKNFNLHQSVNTRILCRVIRQSIDELPKKDSTTTFNLLDQLIHTVFLDEKKVPLLIEDFGKEGRSEHYNFLHQRLDFSYWKNFYKPYLKQLVKNRRCTQFGQKESEVFFQRLSLEFQKEESIELEDLKNDLFNREVVGDSERWLIHLSILILKKLEATSHDWHRLLCQLATDPNAIPSGELLEEAYLYLPIEKIGEREKPGEEIEAWYHFFDQDVAIPDQMVIDLWENDNLLYEIFFQTEQRKTVASLYAILFTLYSHVTINCDSPNPANREKKSHLVHSILLSCDKFFLLFDLKMEKNQILSEALELKSKYLDCYYFLLIEKSLNIMNTIEKSGNFSELEYMSELSEEEKRIDLLIFNEFFEKLKDHLKVKKKFAKKILGRTKEGDKSYKLEKIIPFNGSGKKAEEIEEVIKNFQESLSLLKEDMDIDIDTNTLIDEFLEEESLESEENLIRDDIDSQWLKNSRLIKKQFPRMLELICWDILITCRALLTIRHDQKTFDLMKAVIEKGARSCGEETLDAGAITARRFTYTGETAAKEHLELFAFFIEYDRSPCFLAAIHCLADGIKALATEELEVQSQLLTQYKEPMEKLSKKFPNLYSPEACIGLIGLWKLCHQRKVRALTISAIGDDLLTRVGVEAAFRKDYQYTCLAMEQLGTHLCELDKGPSRASIQQFMNDNTLPDLYIAFSVASKYVENRIFALEKLEVNKPEKEKKEEMFVCKRREVLFQLLMGPTSKQNKLPLMSKWLQQHYRGDFVYPSVEISLKIVDEVLYIARKQAVPKYPAFWSTHSAFMFLSTFYNRKKTNKELRLRICESFKKNLELQVKINDDQNLFGCWNVIFDELERLGIYKDFSEEQIYTNLLMSIFHSDELVDDEPQSKAKVLFIRVNTKKVEATPKTVKDCAIYLHKESPHVIHAERAFLIFSGHAPSLLKEAIESKKEEAVLETLEILSEAFTVLCSQGKCIEMNKREQRCLNLRDLLSRCLKVMREDSKSLKNPAVTKKLGEMSGVLMKNLVGTVKSDQQVHGQLKLLQEATDFNMECTQQAVEELYGNKSLRELKLALNYFEGEITASSNALKENFIALKYYLNKSLGIFNFLLPCLSCEEVRSLDRRINQFQEVYNFSERLLSTMEKLIPEKEDTFRANFQKSIGAVFRKFMDLSTEELTRIQHKREELLRLAKFSDRVLNQLEELPGSEDLKALCSETREIFAPYAERG